MDIFISYAREDRATAERLAGQLGDGPWDVFFDRDIGAGMEWSDELLRVLRHARCVLVLWSSSSRDSFWVRGEATEAVARETYLPVCVDGTEPPRPFERTQALPLQRWCERQDATELQALEEAIAARIGEVPMYGNLEPVAQGEPVTDAHLHLVHSAWRVNRQTPFGLMPYRIHVILFGHPSALRRVRRVEYRLPGYPEGHDHHESTERDRLFELAELANGLCILQALVHLEGQPAGHGRTLRLSRLINMSESGPNLEADFMRPRLPPSSLRKKLHAPAEALREATRLVETLDARTAKKRLVAEGFPSFMAEAAVWEALKKRGQGGSASSRPDTRR